MFAPAAPICFTMCSKYEALFLLVKFVTLPPPVHPLALLSAPLGQPTAKLKVYKLPTTSKKTMQFDEKIKIKNLLNEHVLTIHCVITSPLTLPAQVHETTRAWHPTILKRTLLSTILIFAPWTPKILQSLMCMKCNNEINHLSVCIYIRARSRFWSCCFLWLQCWPCSYSRRFCWCCRCCCWLLLLLLIVVVVVVV